MAGSVILEEFYPQICANMVRAEPLLTEDALSRGRIIDTIEIHGLSVAHGEK